MVNGKHYSGQLHVVNRCVLSWPVAAGGMNPGLMVLAGIGKKTKVLW